MSKRVNRYNKKMCILLLLLTLSNIMCACTPKEPVPETEENIYESITKSQMAFMDILEGNGSFCQERSTSVGNTMLEEVTLAQYCETFTNTFPATLTKVALVDLEHDGIPEVALHIALGSNLDCGVLVLHWENEQVWGYTFSNRQMRDIKADGTFWWSGSASYHGFATATFSQGEFTRYDIVWVEKVDNLCRYYKDEAEITRNEFDSYISQHSALEDAHWVKYSDRGNLFQ